MHRHGHRIADEEATERALEQLLAPLHVAVHQASEARTESVTATMDRGTPKGRGCQSSHRCHLLIVAQRMGSHKIDRDELQFSHSHTHTKVLALLNTAFVCFSSFFNVVREDQTTHTPSFVAASRAGRNTHVGAAEHSHVPHDADASDRKHSFELPLPRFQPPHAVSLSPCARARSLSLSLRLSVYF